MTYLLKGLSLSKFVFSVKVSITLAIIDTFEEVTACRAFSSEFSFYYTENLLESTSDSSKLHYIKNCVTNHCYNKPLLKYEDEIKAKDRVPNSVFGEISNHNFGGSIVFCWGKKKHTCVTQVVR